jgi:Tol biopolymer transport system component
MSPEQARGLGVDHRSDVFSLGAVIYEMLARRKPFEGETPSDTLAAILKTEPPPLARVAPGVPAELARIVTKSLRKDREERYQVVKDLWLDLKALKQELEFQDKLDRSVASDGDRVNTEAMAPGVQTVTLSGPRVTTSRSVISHISESISIEVKKHKLGAALALAAIVLVVTAGGFGVYRWLNREAPIERFRDIRLTRLTNSGNAIDATISPDGKYIVYVLSDRSQQSLYIRQVRTANDKEIVPPARVGYFGITFSPDGNELYYAIKENLNTGTLYRIPVLGGTPIKVLENIDGPISFSPNGKQFVLIRGSYPNPGESALVIANLDGSERNLAVKKSPERISPLFFTGPSWSPDGKIIASVEDGSEKDLSPDEWPFSARVEWLPDMSGLLVIAGDNPGTAQLWLVGYPNGRVRRVTNDLNTYRAIGLTQDGKMMTAVQSQGLVNLWVVPEGDAAKGIRLPTGNISFFASRGNNVSWTPDEKLVFVSNEGGRADIWVSDKDGNNRKQLTANQAENFSPVVSADRRYIVFVSWKDGKGNLWRMNLDGGNPIQLTSGLWEGFPALSPDSRWVIYTSLRDAKPTLLKISIDGGTPAQVTDHNTTAAVVSPDGKLIAYTYPESRDSSAPPNRIAIMPFEGGPVLSTFEMPPATTLLPMIQWSEDSKSVYYTVISNNVSNIWSQPIDGGKPNQVTDFKEMLITSFAWSQDGKQLACTRGNLMRDAILITDLK